MQQALVETDGNVSIIVATVALLHAEDRSSAELAGLLGVLPPIDWPPEYNGPETRQWMRGLLEAHPEEPGFGTWYIIGNGRLAGTAGYKGPPDEKGEVEIGYSVVEADRMKGYASGAVRLLVQRAFRDPRVTAVLAETLPLLVGSQAVLTKCGFTQVRRRTDPEDGEILCYAIRRP
ncbi:GNAT family N-acetyltransferase [Devosia sp.]|uniref:GNAT family N-acetyltransferase n=1 Tax=Devosia sp. TaxID=1871048 RepID=UPI002612724D|nr:GNAT family N-acetyltransferase [Devosia sp.]